ncbi:MAG TPA: hypothetical protein VM012_03180, partial [Flavitalea sp.]|nr:hypothetical protein [Flavitalea sp.]
YLMFNAHYEGLDFKLPKRKYSSKWMKVIDTHENLFTEEGQLFKYGDLIHVQSRSLILLMNPVIGSHHARKHK